MEPQAATGVSPPSSPVVTLARIKAVLEEVPVDRLVEVYEYLIELQEDAEDLAAIEAAKGEPTIPFDQLLEENNITREELNAAARAEGWQK